MKYPIAFEEVGLVEKCSEEKYYMFYRNGSALYERKFKRGVTMTWLEFKTHYPISTSCLFMRGRRQTSAKKKH